MATLPSTYSLTSATHSGLVPPRLDHPTLFNAEVHEQLSDALELLLKAGANLNIANDNGRTALHYAAEFCSLQGCKLLVQGGADINLQDTNGHFPSELVPQQRTEDGGPELYQYLKKEEEVRLYQTTIFKRGRNDQDEDDEENENDEYYDDDKDNEEEEDELEGSK